MSEFDNNEYQTTDTVETVENVETIDNSQTSGSYDAGASYDADPGYQQAPNYDQSAYYGTPDPNEGGSKALAIASLVCGIVSLLCSCCGWLGIIVSVAAVVLGIISINKHEDGKGMAIAGIVCGGVGLIIGIVVVIMGSALSSMDPDAITDYVEQLEESM